MAGVGTRLRHYADAGAVLLAAAIVNFFAVLFFNLREIRYPSYCVAPWYIISPIYYLPSVILGASILNIIPRRWSRLTACFIGALV